MLPEKILARSTHRRLQSSPGLPLSQDHKADEEADSGGVLKGVATP